MSVSDNNIRELGELKIGLNLKTGKYNHIAAGVITGDNVTIGHHCIIEDGVVIGDNVKIENYVLLKKGTIIGCNVFIDSYVRSSGHNIIGNNNTIRYGATIAKDVEIHDNVFISPNVMTIYTNHEGKPLGKTVIKNDVFIGTAAVIGAGVLIETGVVIGAMSYVVKDCKEKGTYVGVPASLLK